VGEKVRSTDFSSRTIRSGGTVEARPVPKAGIGVGTGEDEPPARAGKAR
jgi:hypothetical protein